MGESFQVVSEEGNLRTVHFRRSAREVSTLFGNIRRDISRDMKMPGFRPGRIPVEIIDRRFGNIIVAEVADRIRQDLTSELLSEQDWILDDRDPEGEMQLPVDGQDYEFDLTFSLFETPVPVDYEGVEVSLPSVDEDRMVEETLQSFREQMVEFSEADRPAEAGDLVLLEAVPAGSEGDGEPRSLPVRIGQDQIGPGFDDLLLGSAAGDEFRARMERTSDGAPGADPHLFRVVEVREAMLPGLDDELAGRVADVKTLDELRAKIGDNVRRRHEDETVYLTERQALDVVLERNPFDPPGYMVENLSADFMSRLDEDEPSDETRKAVRDMAAKKVREFLLLRAIAVKEGLAVSDEEIDTERSPDESRSSVLDRLRNRLAVEHVISHATIREMDPAERPPEGGPVSPAPEWRWVRVPDSGAAPGADTDGDREDK
jgi:trigger factor